FRAGQIPADIADVDRLHSPGVELHDLGVNFRVFLAAVADEQEGQVCVEIENPANGAQLVIAMLGGQQLLPADSPVAQEQHRPQGDVLVFKEIAQQVVNVPGTAGDEEQRVNVQG